MRPLIGLPCPEISEPTPSALEALGTRANYIQSIIEAGGLPLIIPFAQGKLLQEYFDRIDGIVFAGGEDVDPAYYNEKPHPKLGRISAKRDTAELELMSLVRSEKKPCLAICRGLQLANVAYGGSLFQDIPSECHNLTANHNVSGGERKQTVAHQVSVDRSSLLFKILALDKVGVNSTHHQAAKVVAPGLRQTALSEDGVIEGLEATDANHFVVCVQWHPESMWQSLDPIWLKLFKALVDASSR